MWIIFFKSNLCRLLPSDCSHDLLASIWYDFLERQLLCGKAELDFLQNEKQFEDFYFLNGEFFNTKKIWCEIFIFGPFLTFVCSTVPIKEWRKKKQNFRFAIDVDLSKSLKHIKLPISLHTCAPTSQLPYIHILGDPEVTANLCCNFVYSYWEGCVICSMYLR